MYNNSVDMLSRVSRVLLPIVALIALAGILSVTDSAFRAGNNIILQVETVITQGQTK